MQIQLDVVGVFQHNEKDLKRNFFRKLVDSLEPGIIPLQWAGWVVLFQNILWDGWDGIFYFLGWMERDKNFRFILWDGWDGIFYFLGWMGWD